MKKKILIIVGIVIGVILIGVGVTYGILAYKDNRKVYSTLTIDVNPSIEVSLNKKNKVLEVKALNEDSKSIVEDININGKEIDKALEIMVDKLEEKGYIKEEDNAILINVESENRELRNIVETTIKEVVEEKEIETEVIVQSIEVTEEIKKIAEEKNISESKAAYVLEQIKDVEGLDLEEVVEKSIEEVKTVVEEKKEEIRIEEEKKAQEEIKKEAEEKAKQQSTQTNTNTNTQTKTNTNTSSGYTCTPPSNLKSAEWCNWNTKRPQYCSYSYPNKKEKDIASILAYLGITQNEVIGDYGTFDVYSGASYCQAYRREISTRQYRYKTLWDSVTGEVLSVTKTALSFKMTESEALQKGLAYYNLKEEDCSSCGVTFTTEKRGFVDEYYAYQVNMYMKDGKNYSVNYDASTGAVKGSRQW